MISIEIQNPFEVNCLLLALRRKVGLQRLRPYMERFGEDLVDSVQRNFDEEGRPEKWKPLKPATIRRWLRKRKSQLATSESEHYSSARVGGVVMSLTKEGTTAFLNRKILTDTAAMRNSVHWKMLDNTTLLLRAGGGPSGKYAATHQLGDESRNIPARPFLMIQEEDWTKFKEEIRWWLEQLQLPGDFPTGVIF